MLRSLGLKAGTVGAALTLAIGLGGCASTVADNLPILGLPDDAPKRPAEQRAYLPVHDMPAAREQAAMDANERAKVQAELIAARDKQAAGAR